MFLLGCSRFDSILSVSDFLHLGPLLPLQQHVRLGLPTFLFSKARLDLTTFVLDHTFTGFCCQSDHFSKLTSWHQSLIAFIRAFRCCSRVWSNLASLCPSDLSVAQHRNSSLFGRLRLDVSILVLDKTFLGLFLLMRSSVYLNLSMLVLDPTQLGSMILLHQPACSASILLVFGSSRLDLPLFVLDLLYLESSSSARSFVRFEFTVSTPSFTRIDFFILLLDLLHLGSTLFPQSSSQAGAAFSAFRAVELGSSLPALDFLHLDLVLPLRSSSRLELMLFPLNFANFGLISSLRNFA